MADKKNPLSHEKARLKELLWTLIQEHEPNCCICKLPFIKEVILPSRGTDNLTEHHQDHDHYNNELGNKRLAHRSCHKSHHSSNNMNFWRQFK